jgi:hypothetical protein
VTVSQDGVSSKERGQLIGILSFVSFAVGMTRELCVAFSTISTAVDQMFIFEDLFIDVIAKLCVRLVASAVSTSPLLACACVRVTCSRDGGGTSA